MDRRNEQSSIPQRVSVGEGIGQVADFADRAVGEQDFNDVETDFDGRIFQEPQIIQAALGKAAAAFRVHRRRGSRPFFGRTRLDFGKDEAIAVAEDQINFTARGTKIGGEKFEAVLPEEFFGGLLAQGPQAQMRRAGFADETLFKRGEKIHSESLAESPTVFTRLFPAPPGGAFF